MNCPLNVIQCRKCKKILVACDNNFYKNKRYKYGYQQYCKKCKREFDKIYRENNKDKIKKQKEEYAENNKEEIRKYNKKWREDNKEQLKEKSHKYYIDNQEYIKLRVKEWRGNNPEKIFNQNNKRRLKEENQGNGFTKEQWYEMMMFFDFKCAYSGEYIV